MNAAATTGFLLYRLLSPTGSSPLPAVRSPSASGAELVEAVSRTLTLAAGVLILAILVPVAILVYRKLLSSLGSPTGKPPDPEVEIARLERKGDFLSAAAICEQRQDFGRAASLFERAHDFARAADMQEAAGNISRAIDLHLRSGGALRAAALHVRTGNHLEAAKIFRNKGDHRGAAKAFEMFGNKAAAAREYGAAGDHERAARLLKEEGMHAEAAEAFRPLLGDGGLTEENVDRYYNYAAFLALAGKRDEAVGIYRSILDLKGEYRKVIDNLRALEARAPAAGRELPGGDTPPAPAAHGRAGSGKEAGMPQREMEARGVGTEGDGLRKVTTLRDVISYGRLEPRHSMKLWTQALRSLSVRHRDQTFFGCLTPDDIRIDMQNRVEISPHPERPDVYTAPEVRAGQAPGPHSDIYAMGVILFEMVTGSLDHIGRRRPAEVRDDIPPWLDDLIIKCTKKDRRDRYLNSEEIFSTLLRLRDSPEGRE